MHISWEPRECGVPENKEREFSKKEWVKNVSCFLFFFFWWLHLWHMEAPRLGVESEQHLIQPLAMATLDLSPVWDPCCSLWQPRILNPLSKTRDWAHILMHPSWVHDCWATTGTHILHILAEWYIALSCYLYVANCQVCIISLQSYSFSIFRPSDPPEMHHSSL